MSGTSRPVAQVVKPEPVIEGAGVHLRRSIGTRRLDHLDPFLLLDHFESVAPADYEAGFPVPPASRHRDRHDHPQGRGASTGTPWAIRERSGPATSSG